MKYNKPAITIPDQLNRLRKRGLVVSNPKRASHYLGNISYYRLRAYTYPFQDNQDSNHPFIQKVSFEDILNLYVFDRQLRLLLFNAIEKIEIAFRTQIIYRYALQYGAFWHLETKIYNNSRYFAQHIASLEKEIGRSKETFIKHYKANYTEPDTPPAWMALEVSSMGLLSKIFSNLRKDRGPKDEITQYFGLKDTDTLENWLRCFSLLRNLCAHHSRVWNRRMTKMRIPRKTLNPFIQNKNIRPYKVYNYISAINYILNIISPGHHFKANLVALMKDCPLAQEKEMGFPKHWENENYWKL
jgi:abortive infection bacteriophage resistance protein